MTRAVGFCSLVLALALPAAAGAAAPVRFSAAPSRVLAGSTPSIIVAAAGVGRCSLSVKYAKGKAGSLGSAPLISGKASFKWAVADIAPAGPAVLTASCGKYRATKTALIVGSLIAPKIAVVKDGFSTRPKFNGTVLSYGVVLKNLSPNADALNVYALVNFVMADNRALGTATQNISIVGAGQNHYLGGSLTFPGLAPITRLEVVIQVGGHQKKRFFAATPDDISIEPSAFDQAYVGGVGGELINDDPPWIFERAQMWAVVFDANGAVLGGGQGSAYARMPPGTRQVFKLTQGFDAIPIVKAAYAMVSPIPSYSAPNTQP